MSGTRRMQRTGPGAGRVRASAPRLRRPGSTARRGGGLRVRAAAAAATESLVVHPAKEVSGVVNLPGGKPTLEFRGRALERLQAMTPQGYQAFTHITITDDHPYAQAFVVIEVHPLGHLLDGMAHG